jgi:exosortase A
MAEERVQRRLAEIPGAGVAGNAHILAKGQWLATIAAIVIGFAAIIALYWAPTVAAVSVWTNSATYRASYLVIPIAVYFIWLRREDVSPMVPAPYGPGLVLVVIFGLIGVVSSAADVLLGQQLAVIGTLQTLLLTTLGWRIFKKLLFPFLFLWMLVPVGDFLIPSLINFVTILTVFGVKLAGVPVEADGNLIKAAANYYSVVEECAALDFLIGALMISLVFGALMYRGTTRRAFLVFAALIIAIVANVFRTTTVIVITHFTEGEIDLASGHQTYGWSVFLIATIVLMWIGFRYRDRDDSGDDSAQEQTQKSARSGFARARAALAAVIFVAGLAPAYMALAVPAGEISRSIKLCFPAKIGHWRQSDASNWRPVVPGAGGYFHRSYSHEGMIVDLYIAYFNNQRQGAELIGGANKVADGKFWSRLSQGREEIRFNGDTVGAAATRLGNRTSRRLVWHWYWVDQKFTGSRIRAKLLQAKARLLGGDRKAALIAVSAVERVSQLSAREAMLRLLDAAPSLGMILARQARDFGHCPGP